MVEMEFRQHSVVHARALEDIREHGLHGERGELQPMTHEVLDTFRALGAIQKRNGIKAARRYIISFTKSAQNVRDVYELNRLAFSHPEDVPVIDVIPLFEQLEDLQNCVNVLEEIVKIPEVQARLKANRKFHPADTAVDYAVEGHCSFHLRYIPVIGTRFELEIGRASCRERV